MTKRYSPERLKELRIVGAAIMDALNFLPRDGETYPDELIDVAIGLKDCLKDVTEEMQGVLHVLKKSN